MDKTNILITGASGMLGGYLSEELSKAFPPSRIYTLGRSRDNDFICDLTAGIPDFGDTRFDVVAHCSGTEDASLAMTLNLEGTRNLLEALSGAPPRMIIYVSSARIYGNDAGENVTEDCDTRAEDPVAKSKTLAERLVSDWAEARGVVLTIVRPARMFGNGVSGETATLFRDAVSGQYIHIRGNDARVSIVSALDVARGAVALCRNGGIFNAADGVNPRFIDLMEAMTANAGCLKRMTHLPASWARTLWKTCRWVPFIDRHLNPSVMKEREKTITIDGRRFAEAAGISYHDTIKVISRTATDYPYTEK